MQVTVQDTLGWEAELSLGYSRAGGKSVLTHRKHRGPLVVQKSLYPEGEGVCHSILVHPPGGLAGEDRLTVNVAVDCGAHAQVTTPAAGKFYKKRGGEAVQNMNITVHEGGILEWFPMENIVYPRCEAALNTRVELTENALFMGWDILCLGLPESNMPFDEGRLFQRLHIMKNGCPMLIESGLIDGKSDLAGPGLMAGRPVTGTFVATIHDEAVLNAIRQSVRAKDPGDRFAVSQVDDLLVCRFLGRDAFAAVHAFTGAWQVIRPAMIHKEARLPRIWNT